MLPAILLILPPIVAIFLLFVTFVFAFPPSRYNKKVKYGGSSAEGESLNTTSAQILVLGDIGRSPRMQYHAMSIAKHGGSVQIIGYQGTSPNVLG